jgi:hypothetical protein
MGPGAGISDQTLGRRSGVGQDSLKIADHEIAPQTCPRSIEETTAAVGGNPVGERRGAQIDIAHEGEPDWSIEASGRSWRRLQQRRGWQDEGVGALGRRDWTGLGGRWGLGAGAGHEERESEPA